MATKQSLSFDITAHFGFASAFTIHFTRFAKALQWRRSVELCIGDCYQRCPLKFFLQSSL